MNHLGDALSSPVLPAGARPGGALFPVLMLVGILAFLSTMVPQMLVQASVGIRQDRSRDFLLTALESGVAFAEARLKYDMTRKLQLSVTPTISRFTVRPTRDNPDFGKEKAFDWEAALVHVKTHDFLESETAGTRTFEYEYRVQARAWNVKTPLQQEGKEVNGILSITMQRDSGEGGAGTPVWNVTGTKFMTIDEGRSKVVLPSPGPDIKL